MSSRKAEPVRHLAPLPSSSIQRFFENSNSNRRLLPFQIPSGRARKKSGGARTLREQRSAGHLRQSVAAGATQEPIVPDVIVTTRQPVLPNVAPPAPGGVGPMRGRRVRVSSPFPTWEKFPSARRILYSRSGVPGFFWNLTFVPAAWFDGPRRRWQAHDGSYLRRAFRWDHRYYSSGGDVNSVQRLQQLTLCLG